MEYKYDFLGKAKFFSTLSLILVLASIVVIAIVGFRAGVEFTGGTQLTVAFSERVPPDELRAFLGKFSPEGVDLAATSVLQETSIEGKPAFIITLPLNVEENEKLIDRIEREMRNAFPVEGDISRTSVGRQVSEDLIRRTWQAILVAIFGMLVYISWRFRLSYAVGAVAALVHDVLIALGICALLGVEISLPVIAALLTIVGYSLNDTIVIFDRVRENRKLHKKGDLFHIINRSINQSLTRTINTSLTTLIPVAILLAFGGPVLRGFALVMLIGVIVGTYSTIFVANPIFYIWNTYAQRLKARAR
ncbi:protein translocase subunit SecF [Candidatus Bipolaricaulota sp. J31]